MLKNNITRPASGYAAGSVRDSCFDSFRFAVARRGRSTVVVRLPFLDLSRLLPIFNCRSALRWMLHRPSISTYLAEECHRCASPAVPQSPTNGGFNSEARSSCCFVLISLLHNSFPYIRLRIPWYDYHTRFLFEDSGGEEMWGDLDSFLAVRSDGSSNGRLHLFVVFSLISK